MDRRLKILVVDDSLLIRKKLTKELEEHGCEVVEAENGKEAVLMFLQHSPDGIFMDIVMPEVDGLEALSAIHQIDPNASVTMLSSEGSTNKLVKALKNGAADFIQKPYTKEQIAKSLANIRKRVESDA